MPRCYVRYDQATQEMYEVDFRPIRSAGAGEALGDVGEQARVPDVRTQRYDGVGGLRAATAQEMADWDTARRAAVATAVFDQQKLSRALAAETLQALNAVRAALVPPLPAITAAQWRNAILTRYQSL